MTHPSTPAAAVSLRFDCEYGSIAYSSSGAPLGERELSMPMKRESIAKVCVEMLKSIDAAATREAALIAERDQLRAMVEDVSKEIHALRAALVYIAEESDDMVALKCAQAALSAPASVGVE